MTRDEWCVTRDEWCVTSTSGACGARRVVRDGVRVVHDESYGVPGCVRGEWDSGSRVVTVRDGASRGVCVRGVRGE